MLGLRGVTLEWFKSYLTDRRQYVKIRNSKSEESPLLFGVPQGSVLGPLLFLVYILPLQHIIKQHDISMHGYADDIQLYMPLSNPSIPGYVAADCVRLEHCLADMNRWMSTNFLKLNSDKTNIMVFGTKSRIQRVLLPTINVAGTPVSISSEPVKNLGVCFDPGLAMTRHVNMVVKSASYQIRNIGRLRNRLTLSTTKTLVQNLVMSKLDYCNSLLFGLPDSLISKLQIIQNKAARIVTRTPKTEHITPILKDLHWLPIKQRIEFKILMMAFKAIHNMSPQYMRDMLVDQTPSRNLCPHLLVCYESLERS